MWPAGAENVRAACGEAAGFVASTLRCLRMSGDSPTAAAAALLGRQLIFSPVNSFRYEHEPGCETLSTFFHLCAQVGEARAARDVFEEGFSLPPV